MATSTKVSVNRSAQVGLDNATLENITSAATKVGAPASAVVTTGGMMGNPSATDGSFTNSSVTFAWTEEV